MSEEQVRSIEHKGFIDRITENSIFVKIVSESACSACHANGACPVSEMQDKEIEVNNTGGNFCAGEKVNLVMKQSLGFKALLIGYVYPFILLFTGLLCASAYGLSELTSGLLSSGLLVPYYFGVYLFRKNIKKSFNFSIRKIY